MINVVNGNSYLQKLHASRHLVLLLGLVVMSLLQPIAQGFLGGLIVYDVVLTLALLAVFTVVAKRKQERIVSLTLAVPAIASQWAAYGLAGNAKYACLVVHHAFLILFFGFAVAVILRGIFEERRVIRVDHVLGTVCGYLLAGAVWGNCFVLAELLIPGSFSVKPEIAGQLADAHSRSFLFNYFSFCTLTGAAYGDVTPIGPAVATLTWLEAMFGQFYIAVVVAQLVGLKLAQVVNQSNPSSD